jgi:hypothetical protein
MSDDKKPFTVNDRRHFTSDGETRDEESSREAPAPPPAPAATAEPKRDVASAPETDKGSGQGPRLDFTGLLLSLGAQASLLLGMAEEEEEGAPPPDLQGAQAVISLLQVLQEKTEGRRTEHESRVLEGILYELRMAYVARARAAKA